MRVGNLGSQASRMSEVGLVWKLLLNNAATDLEISKFSALHIKAKAACIVKLDGVESIVLDIDDVVVINVGPGNTTDNKQTVKVEFSGAVNCSVSYERTRTI